MGARRFWEPEPRLPRDAGVRPPDARLTVVEGWLPKWS